jgi:GT2 family glycosyltransferase
LDASGAAEESRQGVVVEWRRSERAGKEPRAGVAVAVCTLSRPASLRRFLESLREQGSLPDQLVVVDASQDGESERVVEGFARSRPGLDVTYARVCRPLVGLTRQRNQALLRTEQDLVAFFDDDIVLRSGCLQEMERVHRSEVGAVGVAASIENERSTPSKLWRLRQRLGIVADLEPGRYTRSGMSIPWSFLPPGEGTRSGDWLPGGATMWKTSVARELGFLESFEGYGQGEDLEFSLRARGRGLLLLARSARVVHEHVDGGRPNAFRLGYMAVYNRYQVHRRGLPDRGWQDVALFAYAWSLDSILLLRHALRPKHWRSLSAELAGRMWASVRILAGR